MKQLFDKVSNQSARILTKEYSTSFSIAVRLLSPSIRQDIYNIYGFVRVADEIVDTFHDYPQEEMLDQFENEYRLALERGISTNPILHAFVNTVRNNNIPTEYVEAFLKSMRTDLSKSLYEKEEELKDYIYGSAEVVGLMCLCVFVKGDMEKFEQLREPAIKLGSAFQKVNFLRDLKQDFDVMERSYFPNVDPTKLNEAEKKAIEADIKQEFDEARAGIRRLPLEARFGVYVAYTYYLQLLKKIMRTPASDLKNRRVRVSNPIKFVVLIRSYFRYKLALL